MLNLFDGQPSASATLAEACGSVANIWFNKSFLLCFLLGAGADWLSSGQPAIHS